MLSNEYTVCCSGLVAPCTTGSVNFWVGTEGHWPAYLRTCEALVMFVRMALILSVAAL